MPAVLLLLFFLVPAAVALTADLSHFVIFVILACVLAGVLETAPDEDGATRSHGHRQRHEPVEAGLAEQRQRALIVRKEQDATCRFAS